MNNKPLITIVIPVYNGSNYVEQAIKSALNQDYNNLEVIVVNDGSTDNGLVRDICMKYKDKITYYEKENGGCASALNYAIARANGEFISWLSHDDLYLENKISYQIGLYEKYNLDRNNTVISSRGYIIDKDGKLIFNPQIRKSKLLTPFGFFKHLLFKRSINGCGLLIPKAVFDKGLSFREDLIYVLDWNLWLKFALSGVNAYIDNKFLVKNRVHSEQISIKQKSLQKTEVLKTQKELFKILKEYPMAYMREFYYFSCLKEDKKIIAEIEKYLNFSNVKVNKLRLLFACIRNTLMQILKKLYHKLFI